MDIIGNILLTHNFQLDDSSIDYIYFEKLSGIFLRIFSKIDKIDDNILFLFDELYSQEIINKMVNDIIGYNLFSHITEKIIYIQLKKIITENDKDTILKNQKFLIIPFYYKSDNSLLYGKIYISNINLFNILKIINYPFIESTNNIFDEKFLQDIRKFIFQKISNPPKNLDDIFISLPDNQLQLLLNHILHKNIASVDMLASYIRNLDEKGNRILNNLSKNIRNEVSQKIKFSKFISTYRWAEEVSYILRRNIMLAIRETEISIKGLEILNEIRFKYDSFITLEQLNNKSIEEWLNEFNEKNKIRDILNINRKILIEALSFANINKIENIIKPQISKNGFKIFQEDLNYALGIKKELKLPSLIKFLRIIKDIYYTPQIKDISQIDFIKNNLNNIDQINMIVDEINYAQVVYGLMNIDDEWVLNLLSGPLKNIFEDIKKDKIVIKNYGEHRIPECRNNLIKYILILKDENKI